MTGSRTAKVPSGFTTTCAVELARCHHRPIERPSMATYRVLLAAKVLPSNGLRTAEPLDIDAARFIGASIRLYEVEVLVVQVAARVLGDRGEAPALVAAFEARFRRTVVLVSQDRHGTPTFFGPGPIAAVLGKIPFDAFAWRRYRFRPPRPPMLPIPIDPLPSYTSDQGPEIPEEVQQADTRSLKRQTRTLR